MTRNRAWTVLSLLLAGTLSGACGSTVAQGTVQPGADSAGRGLAPETATPPVGGATGIEPTSAPGAAPGGVVAPTGPAPVTGAPGPVDGPPTGMAGGPPPGTSGRGYDATSVYIGVTTSNDTKRAATAAGYDGIDPGDVEANVRAVLGDLNRRGGLFGRKLVPRFHDESATTLTYNPAQAAQSTCSALTQDTPVAIVVNTLPGIDGAPFFQCLSRARMPFITTATRVSDDTFQQSFAPYFHSTVQPSWDAVTPVLIARLSATGYFSAWDTVAGAPGAAPVKIGLLYGNATVNARVFRKLGQQLTAHGFGKPTVYEYDMSNAGNAFGSVGAGVLPFKSAGVTHVIVDEAVLSIFAQAAEQQRYRPRYGLQTVMWPASAKAFMPTGQLGGIRGIGWSPSFDVDVQPPASPAAQHCNALMRKAGLDYSGNATAQTGALAVCDGVGLAVGGFALAGSLDGTAFRSGFLALERSFLPASTFVSHRAGDPAMVGGVRDFGYVAACGCLRYLSTTTHPLP